MSLLKQIDDKGAVLAWSPVSTRPNLVIIGTKVGKRFLSSEIVLFAFPLELPEKHVVKFSIFRTLILSISLPFSRTLRAAGSMIMVGNLNCMSSISQMEAPPALCWVK